MIELYKILTVKYDGSSSFSLVTLRDNDSDARGQNLKIFFLKMQIKQILICTPMQAKQLEKYL